MSQFNSRHLHIFHICYKNISKLTTANKRHCNNDCIFQFSDLKGSIIVNKQKKHFWNILKQKLNNLNFLGNFKCYFVTLNGALKHSFQNCNTFIWANEHRGIENPKPFTFHLNLVHKILLWPVTFTSKPLWAEEQTPTELEKHTPTYTKRERQFLLSYYK